jgi:hypothetical protein
VTASAESPRFTRADALAWSVAWVLRSEDDARRAFALLASSAFADCFAAAVAADVDPTAGTATLLGHAATPAVALQPAGAVEGAVHRVRLIAGTPTGALVVHLDVVPLRGGTTVTVVFLGDSPDPWPAAAVDAVAGAVRSRLRPDDP